MLLVVLLATLTTPLLVALKVLCPRLVKIKWPIILLPSIPRAVMALQLNSLAHRNLLAMAVPTGNNPWLLSQVCHTWQINMALLALPKSRPLLAVVRLS